MNRHDMATVALELKGADHKKLTLTIFNSHVTQTTVDISINRKEGKSHNEHIQCMETDRDNLRQFANNIIKDLDALERASHS